MDKLWANSGDSHLVEPADLFERGLPPALAERMPHSVKDAVAEIERASSAGFKAGYFSVAPPNTPRGDYHQEGWEPVWAALEETGMVLAFHIGTEPHDASTTNGIYYRGPGGAVLNYVET